MDCVHINKLQSLKAVIKCIYLYDLITEPYMIRTIMNFLQFLYLDPIIAIGVAQFFMFLNCLIYHHILAIVNIARKDVTNYQIIRLKLSKCYPTLSKCKLLQSIWGLMIIKYQRLCFNDTIMILVVWHDLDIWVNPV